MPRTITIELTEDERDDLHALAYWAMKQMPIFGTLASLYGKTYKVSEEDAADAQRQLAAERADAANREAIERRAEEERSVAHGHFAR